MGKKEIRVDTSHLQSLNAIFAGIASGKTYDELHVDKHTTSIAGDHSERRVAAVLAGLEEVTLIERTTQNGSKDQNGIDLVVFLVPTFDSASSLVSVNAQIKSSSDGIGEFRRRLATRLGDPNAVDPWLIQERLVLLNGKNSRHAIQRSFRGQLAAIRAAA